MTEPVTYPLPAVCSCHHPKLHSEVRLLSHVMWLKSNVLIWRPSKWLHQLRLAALAAALLDHCQELRFISFLTDPITQWGLGQHFSGWRELPEVKGRLMNEGDFKG